MGVEALNLKGPIFLHLLNPIVMKTILLLALLALAQPPAVDPPRCTVYAIQDTSNPRHRISRPLKPDPLRVVDSVRVAPDSVGITVIALLKRQDVDFVGYKCDEP